MQHKTIKDLSISDIHYINKCLYELPPTDQVGPKQIIGMLYYDNLVVTSVKDHFVIYKITNEDCHVFAVYFPGNLQDHIEGWMDYLKSQGVKHLTAQSALPEDKFIKATKFTKKYSVYERFL